MMGCIDLNWDFSQFDRDNMNRFTTAVTLEQANVVLADVVASPRAARVAGLLATADAAAADALAAHASMDYLGAATHAEAAYDAVLEAADELHVPVEPQAWQADGKAKGASSFFVDELEGQRSKP